MKIGFAILLDDKSHNFARQIELEICNKFNLCMGLRQSPHITIKTPFDINKLEPFIEYLEFLSKEIEPFYIELDGFNYFEPKVIYLNVKKNFSLEELHFRILKDIKEKFEVEPNQFEGKNMKFHSSVALEDVTEEKFENAKKYLTKYKPNFKFKAKTLGIFYHLGNADWIIVRRIKLNS